MIQDFAHLSVKMDEGITPQKRDDLSRVLPDRPKTPTEQRWDAMSDLQKMQLQGLLEHYSNEYLMEVNGNKRP